MTKNKELSLLGIITLAFCLPLLIVSSDYQDDIYRSASGDSSFWFENARPISVYLLKLINQNAITPDIFPLTLVLSIIVLGVVSYFISNSLFPNNFIARVSSFCIIISNPFFLQNLSYKYDCITMAACLALSYIFVFKSDIGRFIYSFALKIVIVFLLLCIYQPALSYIAGLMALHLSISISKLELKKWLNWLLISSASILISFVFYKYFISDHMLNQHYKIAGSILSIDKNLPISLLKNYMGYFRQCWEFLSKPFVFITVTLTFISLIINSLKGSVVDYFKHIICIMMLAICLTSVNIVLKEPKFQPREMIGFSLSFIYLIAFASRSNIGKYLSLSLAFAFIFTSFSISCYLSNMRNLVELRDSLIVNDIKSSMYKYNQENVKVISFMNDTLDILPAQTAILKSNPLIYKLLGGVNFKDDWYSQAVVNQKYNIQKQVKHIDSIPEGLNWDDRCYTRTALSGGVMFVEVGIYCK